MGNSQINIFDADAHMGEISGALHAQLRPDFADYGLSLERFFITTIVKPDGDKAYERFKEIHVRRYADVAEAQIRQQVGVIDQQTAAQRMVIEAAALAEKRVREGYTYQQERGYDVAEKIGQNEGIGNFSNMGIGLGMMGGVAGGMGAAVAGITTQALDPITPTNAGPTQSEPTGPVAGFGVMSSVADSNRGAPNEQVAQTRQTPEDTTAFKQKIDKLILMKESGLLSESEFAEEKKKLLDSL
jgi:hypothetical protein